MRTPSAREEEMMEMVIASAKRGRAFSQSFEDDEERIEHGHAEREEHRRDFPTGIDAERSEEESEEHGTGVAENRFSTKIEPCACDGDSTEREGDERDLRLVHSAAQAEEAKGKSAQSCEHAHLTRNAIEPIRGVRGESDPSDCEEAAPKGKGAYRSE